MQKESIKLDKRFEKYGLRMFEFKFKQIQIWIVQKCEILVLQYSPGLYEYTGKRIDEFGVPDVKINLNENLIWNLQRKIMP